MSAKSRFLYIMRRTLPFMAERALLTTRTTIRVMAQQCTRRERDVVSSASTRL